MRISDRYVIPSSSQSSDPGFIYCNILNSCTNVWGIWFLWCICGTRQLLITALTSKHPLRRLKQVLIDPIRIRYIVFICLKRSWQLQTFTLIWHVVCILHSSFSSILKSGLGLHGRQTCKLSLQVHYRLHLKDCRSSVVGCQVLVTFDQYWGCVVYVGFMGKRAYCKAKMHFWFIYWSNYLQTLPFKQ